MLLGMGGLRGSIRRRNLAKRWILLVLTVAGLALLGIMGRHALRAALTVLPRISPLAWLGLLLAGVWTLAAAVAWRVLIVASGVKRIPHLATLWLIRLEAQAVNLLLPLAGMGGEALRASTLARGTQQTTASIASVALDIVAEIAACFAFAAAGTLLDWRAMRVSSELGLAGVLGSVLIALAMLFAPTLLPGVARWRGWGRRAGSMRAFALSISRGRRAGMGRSLVWHLVERFLIAGETWVYAHALGLPMSWLDAVFATAVMTLLGSVLFFVPGQLGVADGGLALAMSWLGFSWSYGLAVALTRRMRQLLIALIGLLALLVAEWRPRPVIPPVPVPVPVPVRRKQRMDL